MHQHYWKEQPEPPPPNRRSWLWKFLDLPLLFIQWRDLLVAFKVGRFPGDPTCLVHNSILNLQQTPSTGKLKGLE